MVSVAGDIPHRGIPALAALWLRSRKKPQIDVALPSARGTLPGATYGVAQL